jgi:voltage-gated potassium channel
MLGQVMARSDTNFLQHLITVVLVLILLLLIGTFGYAQIEGWNWFDALYMTFISFSTVGFQEVFPLSMAGRLLTMGLILFGMVVIAMLSASVTSWFVRNELLTKRKIFKMKQKISRLNGHIIICGGGNTGMAVINEFLRAKKKFVLIEDKPEIVNEIRERYSDIFIIEGNATRDEVLQEANIAQASGLISALSLDADNLFVVVSARALNPGLVIISRSVEPSTESKLYNAGATYVISPNMVEGTRMASVILRPTVVNFLEVMMREEGLSLRMEEINIPPNSSFTGITLAEARIPQRTGLIVLAVKHQGSAKWNFNPGSNLTLKEDDKVIVLGEAEKIEKLQKLVQN